MKNPTKNQRLLKYSDVIQQLINREETVEYKIIVDEVSKLSPQLKELNDYFKTKPTFATGGLYSTKKNGIAVHVSFKFKHRALLILDTLSKAFIKRGFNFAVVDKYKLHDDKDRDYTVVEINNIQIKLKLKEKQSRKTIKNLKDIEDEDLRSRYKYGFTPGSSLLIPNGTFCFSVDAYTFNACTTKWEDKEGLPLESQLNQLIKDLIIISEEIRLRDLHFEAQRRQQQLQDELRRKKEQEEKEFQKRMDLIKELGLNSLIYEQVKKVKANISTKGSSDIFILEWIDEYIKTQDPLMLALNKM